MQTIEISGIRGNMTLRMRTFDEEEEINVDKLLQIDFKRLPAEVVTFPVILNKLGVVLAESTNKHSEKNLALEIFIAKFKEEKRTEIVARGEKMTQDDIRYKVEYELKTSSSYKMHNNLVMKAKKELDYVNSLYWAAKDKSDKLNKLSEKMYQGDSSYMEESMKGEINGIKIIISN